MSQIRPIWNDGQGLATPDLQRPCDVAGAADDRVLEILNTPGSVQKRILPLLEETASINPRLLAIPAAATPGAVSLQPCELIAGAPSASQQVSLAATLYAAITSATVAGNTSGSTRYDLIYATVQRSVSVTGTRKIKSATDGTLSSQTINLADAPAVTLGVNSGFLTGATAPTLAQINAAVPADTAPSSSTFGAFNFPVAYVTVANGYVAGTALSQDSTGGTTYIAQAWPGGFIQHQRVRGPRPGSIYYGSANEKPSTTLTNGVQFAERWGSLRQFFTHFKLLSTTGTNVGAGTVLDNSIDWRSRFVWGFYAYLGSATQLPVESAAGEVYSKNPTIISGSLYNSGAISPLFSGAGSAGGLTAATPIAYTDGVTTISPAIAVNTAGALVVFNHTAAVIDGTNGDLVAVVLFATDQLKLNG